MLLGILKSVWFFLLVVVVAFISYALVSEFYRRRWHDEEFVMSYTILTLTTMLAVPMIIFEIYVSLFAN